MRKGPFILFLLSVASLIQAQTPNANEILRQKNTQRKYSAQQVIALKAYLEVLKKGYSIVHKGLDEVGASKGGAYLRDQQYFSSLKDVSAVVRNSPRINEIHSCQQKIRAGLSKLNEDCKDDSNFSPAEVNYISKVHRNMIKECEFSLDELTFAATSSTEMTDAERLHRVDQIADGMLDKLAFTQNFISSTRTLSRNRAKEKKETEVLRKLHSRP